MGVHQSRQHPGVGKVNHGGAVRNLYVCADGGDFAVLVNQDNLIVLDGSGGRIDNVAGADGRGLRGGSYCQTEQQRQQQQQLDEMQRTLRKLEMCSSYGVCY